MEGLALYYFPGCPFCLKVLEFMETNNITIPLKNIHEDSRYLQELFAMGGSRQVPCLVINGKALYESDDIIVWLKENRNKIKT